MKPGKTGLARLLAAAGYSWQGLKAAYRHEAAFRQELLLVLVGVPLAFVVGDDKLERLLLVGVLLLLLVVELLNSAIEAVVDLASPEYHSLAGRAKDLGSAAVLLTSLLVAATWLTCLLF